MENRPVSPQPDGKERRQSQHISSSPENNSTKDKGRLARSVSFISDAEFDLTQLYRILQENPETLPLVTEQLKALHPDMATVS